MSQVVFSLFVQTKVRMWFRMMDTNKNGSMGLDDFTLVADRFAKAYQLTEEEKRQIQKWLGDGINMLIQKGRNAGMELPLFMQIQTDMETGAKVTEDRFVEAFGEFVTLNPALAGEAMREMVGVYFDIFDHDKDGFISPEEMKIGLQCFGMEGGMAEALGVLFTDYDGTQNQISRKTYLDMWVDFLVGEDRTNKLLNVFAPNEKF